VDCLTNVASFGVAGTGLVTVPGESSARPELGRAPRHEVYELHGPDLLLHTILVDDELLRPQVGHEAPVRVGDDDVDPHAIQRGAEDPTLFLWLLLLRQNRLRRKHRSGLTGLVTRHQPGSGGQGNHRDAQLSTVTRLTEEISNHRVVAS
jgi:hypothetical protein